MSNKRKGNKKLSVFLVLRALELMSDKEHPIKQQTLANAINELGGVLKIDLWCDRKTVGRHLKTLSAVGYKIVYIKGKGCYLESYKFTTKENELLTNLVDKSNTNYEVKNTIITKLNAATNAINPKQFCDYLKKEFEEKRYKEIIFEDD